MPLPLKNKKQKQNKNKNKNMAEEAVVLYQSPIMLKITILWIMMLNLGHFEKFDDKNFT